MKVLSEMVFVISYIELYSIDCKIEFPFDIKPYAIRSKYFVCIWWNILLD